MEKLTLTERSEEISNKIPKQFRSLVLNAVIARSITNGTLIKELSLYLSQNDIINIANELEIGISVKSNTRERIIKPRKVTSKPNESEKLFFGFDED